MTEPGEFHVINAIAGWAAKGIVAGAKWFTKHQGEADSRLAVSAIRTLSGGFEITVRWDTPSSTEGYLCDIKLLGPTDIVLLEGVRKRMSGSPYVANHVESLLGKPRVSLTLRTWPDDAPGQVSAVAYVSAATFIKVAQIKISICRAHNGKKLVSRKQVLSTPELGN